MLQKFLLVTPVLDRKSPASSKNPVLSEGLEPSVESSEAGTQVPRVVTNVGVVSGETPALGLLRVQLDKEVLNVINCH